LIINKKNEGTHVHWELAGTRLSVRDGELTLDLSRYERDYPVHLDISENAFGMLIIGPSRRYIAELDIPAREYIIQKGEPDDMGFPKITKTAVPFDTVKVSLTLWALEN
jgi:hypothetical protein